MVEPLESDWKLYREKIAEWLEHYMENLIKKYADYLDSDFPVSVKLGNWKREPREIEK